jgi:hypothetical protein
MNKYRNKKTGEIYTKFSGKFINSTNAQDGQEMIGYFNSVGILFVREKAEFYNKFIPLEDEQ